MLDKQLKVFGDQPRSIQDDQKMGKPVKEKLSFEEKALLDRIVALNKASEFDFVNPDSIFNEKFEALPENEQDKVSVKAGSIMTHIKHILAHFEATDIDTENMTMKNLLQAVLYEGQPIHEYLKF